MNSRLALALIAALLLSAPAAAHPGKEHKSFHRVNGKRVAIATHGDPIKEFKRAGVFASRRAPAFAAPTPTALPGTWAGCGSERSTDNTANQLSNAPQIKVIYAHPSDKLSQFSARANLIQADIKAIFEKVASESGNTRSLRFDLGTGGPAGCVDIMSVTLPNDQAHYTTDASSETDQQNRTFNDLASTIPNLAGVHNYIVYADFLDSFSGGTAGVGQRVTDDSVSASNGSNLGELTAILWGDSTGGFTATGSDAARRDAVLHEITHNLGAVQDSAPHSTLAGHCWDGDLTEDVMCYDDGGSGVPVGGLTHPCSASSIVEYDCNNDDYFDPTPSGYLATHWNTYKSYFTCPVSKCESALSSPVVSALSASPGSPVTFQPITLTATASDPQGIARYEWDFDGNGTFDRTTAGPSTTTTYGSSGARTVKVRVSDNDQAFSERTRTLSVATNQPPDATFAINPFPLAAGQLATLDASGSTDPDDGIAGYGWDLDGNGSFERSGKVIQASFAAGDHAVSLAVADRAGNIAISTSSFTVGPAGSNLGPSAFDELIVKSKYALKKALKKGLSVTVDVNVAGATIDATLFAPKSALKVKKSAAKLKKVGHKKKVASKAGPVKLKIKLSKKARKAFKKKKKVKLTLVVSVTAPGRAPGNITTKVLLKK